MISLRHSLLAATALALVLRFSRRDACRQARRAQQRRKKQRFHGQDRPCLNRCSPDGEDTIHTVEGVISSRSDPSRHARNWPRAGHHPPCGPRGGRDGIFS